VSLANSFESQTICTKANALEVMHRYQAAGRPGHGGCKQSPSPPGTQRSEAAAIATPASCATRLTVLLMPDARPSSDEVPFDKT
jgi:hypothetical protein